MREHLFEPFRTTKASGTGLGLATVHGVVVQSGGFIMVDSGPNGTAFRIHLPMPDLRASGLHEAVRGKRLAPVRARIAVVDDQAEIRGWIAEVLTEAGHRVERLASAEEALPSVATLPPDLLITDLVMPGMGGVSMVDHLRATIPRLRVLYVSGWAEDQFPGGQAPERTRFLAKPFSREALLDAVDEALSEESGNYPAAGSPDSEA